jgi:hypothetical protein
MIAVPRRHDMDYMTIGEAMNMDYALGYFPPEPCCDGVCCRYCGDDDVE